MTGLMQNLHGKQRFFKSQPFHSYGGSSPSIHSSWVSFLTLFAIPSTFVLVVIQKNLCL